MNLGLRAFLSGLIDYAGLFPPAKLPFEQAIRAYVRLSRDEEAWMLGRFVCPAAKLEDLDPLRGELGDGGPVLLAALGRGGAAGDEFLTGLVKDLEAIAACRGTHGDGVDIDVLETRLPAEALATPSTLPALLDEAERTFKGAIANVYYEIPIGGDVAAVVGALRGRRGRGLKMRCGGLATDDFPDGKTIVRFLLAAGHAGVPVKATAGLHHPLPHFDPSIPAPMHGFVNLCAAGILGRSAGLNEDEVNALIAETDPTQFEFSDEGLRWRDHRASVRQIADARRSTISSVGSCSFDEPRDDLRALGWL